MRGKDTARMPRAVTKLCLGYFRVLAMIAHIGPASFDLSVEGISAQSHAPEPEGGEVRYGQQDRGPARNL